MFTLIKRCFDEEWDWHIEYKRFWLYISSCDWEILSILKRYAWNVSQRDHEYCIPWVPDCMQDLPRQESYKQNLCLIFTLTLFSWTFTRKQNKCIFDSILASSRNSSEYSCISSSKVSYTLLARKGGVPSVSTNGQKVRLETQTKEKETRHDMYQSVRETGACDS